MARRSTAHGPCVGRVARLVDASLVKPLQHL
jgi:hypothetical protein